MGHGLCYNPRRRKERCVRQEVPVTAKKDRAYPTDPIRRILETRDPASADSVPYPRDPIDDYPTATYEKDMPYDRPGLPNHLHVMDFRSSFWDDAKAYYEKFSPAPAGCSAVRCGGIFARNYDCKKDNAATFVVRRHHTADAYASVGIATLGMDLSERFVRSGRKSSLYRVLPGRTVDGLNEKGVFACVNVIPKDETKDAGWGGTDLSTMGAVRKVLDEFDNAREAADWVAGHCFPPTGTGYSYHFMIGDADSTWVVEDGFAIEKPDVVSGRIVMTNFRITDWPFADDGTVNVEALAASDPYGTGVERFNLLAKADLSSVQKVLAAMREARFTLAYASANARPLEFADPEVGTVADTEDLVAAAQVACSAWSPRDLSGRFWHTSHSSLYVPSQGALLATIREGNVPVAFFVP